MEVLAQKFKLGEISTNFISTLNENGRLGIFEKVVDSYKQLTSAQRGEKHVTVISAQVILFIILFKMLFFFFSWFF